MTVKDGAKRHAEGAQPQAASKATGTSHTILFLPDWMVVIVGRDTIARSPGAFFQKLETMKTLSRSILGANSED